MKTIEGNLVGNNNKYALIVSRFNRFGAGDISYAVPSISSHRSPSGHVR